MTGFIKIVVPPDWAIDPGIITSAIGPKEAGYLDDVVGKPPRTADPEDPSPAMILIDPPVSPFSPLADLLAWRERLKELPQDQPEVKRAIADADRWLALARDNPSA